MADALFSLNRRQVECLRLAAAGRTSLEIADFLGLSARTVDQYFGEACQRLGVRNRTQAVAKALAMGVIVGNDRTGGLPGDGNGQFWPAGRCSNVVFWDRSLSPSLFLRICGPDPERPHDYLRHTLGLTKAQEPALDHLICAFRPERVFKRKVSPLPAGPPECRPGVDRRLREGPSQLGPDFCLAPERGKPVVDQLDHFLNRSRRVARGHERQLSALKEFYGVLNQRQRSRFESIWCASAATGGADAATPQAGA